MSGRPLTTFALALALAPAAFAQGAGAGWVLVAPQGEEFAVRMPPRPVMVARVLPFGEKRQLARPSYEAAEGKFRYSVLSFEKSKGDFLTFAGLVEGLRHALLGAQNGDYLIEHERDLTLDGHAGKQFTLRTGKPVGTVRVYEARRHFYVLISFGGRAGEPEADQFFSSFTLAPQPGDAARAVKLNDAEPKGVPDSFWPAVTVTKSVGIVIGDRADAKGKRVVEGGVLNGKVVSSVPPAYPPIAKAARASGTVVVQLVFDEEGRVISATPLSGHPLLQQAAVAAVRQWRFAPVVVEGQPVKVAGRVNVNFVLQ